MASFTENYNLIKPGQEDIYNIGDFNDNADIIDAELKDRVLKSGDISGTQITAFDTISEEFPVPVAGESTRTIAGKIRKFIQDFNNFKTSILTVGMLINNAVTNNSQLPVSAAVAKVLQDQITQLNSDFATLVEYTVTLGSTQSTQTLGSYYASISLGFVNGANYRVVVCSCFLATNATVMGTSHCPNSSSQLYVNGNVSGGTYKVQLLKIAL